jgi:hypothetical protein
MPIAGNERKFEKMQGRTAFVPPPPVELIKK